MRGQLLGELWAGQEDHTIDASLYNRCRGARRTVNTYWYRLGELSVVLT